MSGPWASPAVTTICHWRRMIVTAAHASSDDHAPGDLPQSAAVLADRLVVADDFLDDEVEEFLREVRVQMCCICELPQPRDLGRFARRIGGRRGTRRPEFHHR